MARQLIFCLETNKRANTDYIYIKEAIDFFYQESRQVKISLIYGYKNQIPFQRCIEGNQSKEENVYTRRDEGDLLH